MSLTFDRPFYFQGGGTVHLTGYLVDDDSGDMTYDDSFGGMEEIGSEEEEEDEEEDGEEEEEEEETPQLVKKRKLQMNGDSPASAKKKKVEPSALDKLLADSKKSKEKDVKQAQAMKKILEAEKKKKKSTDESSSDDDDDDDSDEEMDQDMDDEEESDEGLEEEEDDDSDEEDSPTPVKKNKTPAKPVTPVSTKKDKKKEILGAKNGTPGKDLQKKPPPSPQGTPSSVNSQNDASETPKSKKKNKKNKNKDKDSQESKQVNGQQQKSPTKTPGPDATKTPKKTLKGGVVVEDLKVGNGPEVTPGKFVGMYYEGKLKSGKVFDKCQSGKPFKFKLGKGEVIKGWDVGLNGMKVGGKRRMTIPAPMAYGAQGAGPDIPPNATLVFDVECKTVN